MKGTIKVFGYAILEGLVLALVQLNNDQMALCGTCSHDDGKAHSHEDDIAASFARSVSLHSWKETRCTVVLEDIVDGNRTVEDLPKAGRLSYLPVPRVRFIILGSTDDPFEYSRSLGGLHNRLAEEFSVSVEGVIQCEKKINVGGVDVYSTETAWLVLDDRSVELDAVFTGFYQPYSTGPRSRSVVLCFFRCPWLRLCDMFCWDSDCAFGITIRFDSLCVSGLCVCVCVYFLYQGLFVCFALFRCFSVPFFTISL
uniref:Putative secreted protein n=1 Tax=Ixodes ricinus TaxID=34613 RepID=A0A6B0V5K9_IXORI